MKYLWNQVKVPEIDWVFMEHLLSNYKNPRKKLSDLLKSGEVLQVKKGLYVLNDKISPVEAPSRLRLANLIYGPSYVSDVTALAFYGLIPEAVHETISVCCKRRKEFNTPLGIFCYHYLKLENYSCGITQAQAPNGSSFLIASPEKALIDFLWHRRKHLQPKELKDFLLEETRIELTELASLSITEIKAITSKYNHPVIKRLATILEECSHDE